MRLKCLEEPKKTCFYCYGKGTTLCEDRSSGGWDIDFVERECGFCGGKGYTGSDKGTRFAIIRNEFVRACAARWLKKHASGATITVKGLPQGSSQAEFVELMEALARGE